MFSTCSELTPRAPIPDGRMAQIMQPWAYYPFSNTCSIHLSYIAEGGSLYWTFQFPILKGKTTCDQKKYQRYQRGYQVKDDTKITKNNKDTKDDTSLQPGGLDQMNALIRCRERRQTSVQSEITNECTVLNINIWNASPNVPVSWEDNLCCVTWGLSVIMQTIQCSSYICTPLRSCNFWIVTLHYIVRVTKSSENKYPFYIKTSFRRFSFRE